MTAPTSSNFGTQPYEGVDFAQTYTVSATTPEVPAPPFAVGTHAIGTNGSEYVFIKAAAALARWQCVAVDKTFAAVVTMTVTLANQQFTPAWPQVAIASGDYGWVAIRGESIGVLARKNSLANKKLYVSGLSPGVLSSTSVITSAYVSGIILTTSSTSAMTGANNSAVVVAVATWPRTLT